jgi:hypothetical protein
MIQVLDDVALFDAIPHPPSAKRRNEPETPTIPLVDHR